MCISYEYSIWGVSYIHINRRLWSYGFTRCVSFNFPDPGTIWDGIVHALRLHCVPPCLLFILDRQRKLTVVHKYIVPHTPLFHCTVWHGYHRYLWDFLHHIHSGDNWCDGWQLMWLFRFVAFPVWGRSGLWPFRSVAVSVCGRSGLWPFGLWPFWLWPFRFVAVMTCYRYCDVIDDVIIGKKNTFSGLNCNDLWSFYIWRQMEAMILYTNTLEFSNSLHSLHRKFHNRRMYNIERDNSVFVSTL